MRVQHKKCQPVVGGQGLKIKIKLHPLMLFATDFIKKKKEAQNNQMLAN